MVTSLFNAVSAVRQMAYGKSDDVITPQPISESLIRPEPEVLKTAMSGYLDELKPRLAGN